ncbi:6,7-dimethyl-8-ribityllumazine synthase [Phenylobacterium sp.]|uniref:6,7-dimethyl-8-ribityllumazine synthase n=1 Tax=Phenylobacterium sp. TaxID=1871053 RepID=UPI002735C07E|nr:6,7-dimethyl-8-ribityllumazine synthase [Phenylobacterium sp.]MDP3852113.1 6,7-dimethyl-8-ribityllumazine synthase [Phenylobacterium sp.]
MTQVTYELPTANGAFRQARIAFIQAGWHTEIVDNAYQGFIAEIGPLGFAESSIDRFETPGVFEIPLHAQTLAKTGRYAAIVAAGFVVNGGIYRHDFVSQTVISGLMQVQLSTEVPVFSVVLTPHHFHDHDEHRAFFREHFLVKGAEAAQACAKTLHSLARLAAAA